MKKNYLNPKLPHKNKKGYNSGSVCGFITTARRDSKKPELFISFCVPDEKVKDILENELEILVKHSRFGLCKFELTYTYVILSFSENKSEYFKGFIAHFYPFIEALGVRGADTCPICKRSISKSSGVEKYIGGNMFYIHMHCAIRMGLEVAVSQAEGLPELRKYKDDLHNVTPVTDEKVSTSSVLKGIFGAVVGGLIGALLWSIVAVFGWVVALVAILIILLVLKGYFLFGGENNDFTIPIIFVVSVLSILWGQVLAAQIQFIHKTVLELTANVPLRNVYKVVYNYLSSSFQLEQGSLFYGIGVILALASTFMFLIAAMINNKR
ncbi:MAG TPA: hypothetical protein VFD52_08915 [Clostridia bacterium]|nr:hypothetical protein [Clostridia bacterium]